MKTTLKLFNFIVYNDEDFVEGIRPNLSESGEAVGFSRQPGIFKELVRKSINNPSKKFMLIIDEINRGNISKIFGELIYLLEYRDEKISLTYSPNDKFYIPSNLYIIGTMNSADRSIAFVDYALRRRFYFIEFYPESRILDTSILYKWLIKHNVEKSVAEKIELMLQEINLKIKEKLDMEHQIGYSHFMVKDLNEDRLRKIINYALIPLVEQYFYGRKDIVDDIKRICNNTLTIFSSNKINPTT